jgi:chromosome segregation protein
MSVECYKSKGRNSYYYEGKKVSKNSARSLSKKLPKCVSKSKANMIKSLKKQLKEVLTHREQYKTTSADLDSRLKGMNDQLDKLQEERLTLIEEVNKREKIIYSKNDEITERMEVIGRLDDENRELKEKATRYYNEGQALEQENRALQQRLDIAENTIEGYKNKYADDIGKAEEEIKELNQELEQTAKEADKLNQELEQKTRDADQCEADKLAMQEDINLLRNVAENLRNKLQEEKNECLDRVQRAIEETEGNISKREARKYEKELSDLNGKLRLSEEALDELRKAGTLQGKKLPAKAVKKAIKKMKQAGANIKFVE